MSLDQPSHRMLLSVLIAALALPSVARAADDKAPDLSPDARKAADAGLKWLAQQQLDSGAFSFQNDRPHTGVTAIAGLAMLASGSTPDDGPYKAHVRKAIDFILSTRQKAGLLTPATENAPMYSHGFALLFLSQAHALTKDKALQDALAPAIKDAIAVSEQSQNGEGGWRYQPKPADADLSVTSGQLTALHAAQSAGFDVNKETLARGVKYVEACRNADGGFSYMAAQAANGGNSGPARTAAALAVILRAGHKDDAIARAAQDYLTKLDANANARAKDNFFFYGNYYRTQAAMNAGALKDYHASLAKDLLDRQEKSTGRWKGEAGEQYATAMAVMMLELPSHPLPAFKGQ